MPQRIVITQILLDFIVEGQHTGIISNIVLEERERSPEELRETLTRELRKVLFK